ncbi:alpha/beta fold hydrolase [Mycobacterium vicinigordonae]|uniref:Alpha/beta hydrolase n=1 Tax=Mycobacterium vicinigordonae TaxID=1719132 RepID=A0A7D6DXX1_9MYCO|nr:alpha/beta hydrolase [Mycobacterium vicinigordonae]QLL07547.1 alpha/beta hydrolase [Mycobacterium vicinigordonae]
MSFSTGTVQSADGTTVSHRIVGEGGAPVVLVHGGIQAAQNFQRLAEMLSSRFTVYVPDRRGRRPGVPAGADYGLAREGEDLDALLRLSGARRLFGLSSGAVIALYTAIQYGAIDRLALYEPPLTIDGAEPAAWLPQFEEALAGSGPAAAVTAVLKGTGDRSLLQGLPAWLLTGLARIALAVDAKTTGPQDITLRDLVPTMRLDGIATLQSVTLVNPRIDELRARVLLLGGEKSAQALHLGLDALMRRLPDAKRVELKKIGHVAADNRGKPQQVARLLEDFWAD